MPTLPEQQGTHLLRLRTVKGQVEVFVRIDGQDHIIGGVKAVGLHYIDQGSILTADITVCLGGLGDQ